MQAGACNCGNRWQQTSRCVVEVACSMSLGALATAAFVGSLERRVSPTGSRFAVEELQLALVRLYQKFTFKLDPKHHDKELPLRVGITLSPAGGVWVRAVRRPATATA